MAGRGALVAAVVLSVASLAQASWMAPGAVEPSTSYDRAPGMMWTDADQSGGPSKIYFQAFVSVEGLTMNPNLAATDGRFLAPGAAHHRAMLGIWKDCNKDHYIGAAEGALQDYSASLLLDRSVCPVGSPFNDGLWVSEMIGIGMNDPCEYRPAAHRERYCPTVSEYHPNERVIYANGTMVWGDVGTPGESPTAECPATPPPGTTSGTGALLAYVDCQDGRAIARGVNDVDGGGELGLRFEDPAHPERSTSLLNVRFPVTLFGGPQGAGLLEADSGAPAATVWDCAEPRFLEVRDPTGITQSLVVEDPSGGRLSGPQPPIPVVGRLTIFDNSQGDPGTFRPPITDETGAIAHTPRPSVAFPTLTGSWWDAAMLALDGPAGDCDASTPNTANAAAPGPLVESGVPQLDEARKDRTSLSFTFYDGHRGINENLDFVWGALAPSDLGLLYLRHGRGGAGPLWSADAPSAHEPQLVTRGSLTFTGGEMWSYYATLGPAALGHDLKRPTGSEDGLPYGFEACGANTSGVHNGWVCDRNLWWKDALGNDATPRYAEGAVRYAALPGQLYHLRDVDCYDGHVAAEGVFLSLALLAESTC